jgi:uncharacterized phage infection (PIP) family protein YhgE
MNGQN